MIRPTLDERVRALRRDRVPFVHARVILAEPPTSARPGDEALVTGDGSLDGFVGGSCAEATVVEQSLELLEPGRDRDGRTVVLRITPTPEPGLSSSTAVTPAGKKVVHNPCLSGGTLEVFLEADLPPPLIAVAGRAPIAAALRSIGAAAGFELRSYAGPDDLPGDTAAAVVASHGIGEEQLLVGAVEADVPYVGLVASPRRGTAVLAALPLGEEQKARIHTPAGFDIGARSPEEVALSILAEIVSLRPRPQVRPAPASGEVTGFATDPVCRMSVRMGPDAVRLVHEEAVVWFCGSGCRDAFAADPAAYAGG